VGGAAEPAVTMGHFATALIPYGRVKDAPLWVLLLCAQLPDFLWLGLALAGVEVTTPESFLDVTITGMKVEMVYSHVGVGVVGLAAIAGGAVYAAYRRRDIALWCGALVFVHWLCDLLSGWAHEWLFAGSRKIGFDLYARSPYAAFAIEAAFSAALVFFYVRGEARQGRAVSRTAQIRLYAVFVGGTLLFAPTAYVSMRSWLGL
jgi:hypothetical protein